LKKAVVNVLVLLSASAGGAICAFLIQVILARQMEPQLYGTFSASLATVLLISALSSLGVPGFITRAFGAEGVYASRWLKSAYQLVALGVICCVFIVLVWAGMGPHDFQAVVLLGLFLPLVASQPFIELVTVKLQLEKRFYALACWQLFPNLLRLIGLGVIVTLLQSFSSVTSFGLLYTITALLISITGFALMRGFPERDLGTDLLNKDTPVFVEGTTSSITIFRYSIPFALSGIFYIVYFQSDVILLNYLSSSEIAGFYNVAFTIMVAIYLLPNIVYQKFLLPRLYSWVHHDHQQLLLVYRRGMMWMAPAGLMLMLVMFVLMPIAIPWLFGEAYRETISILNILLLCIPIRFISSSIAAVLVSESNIKRKATAMGCTAFANITLNIMFIPHWHAYGAAFATLLSELLLLILFYRTVQKHVFLTTRKVAL